MHAWLSQKSDMTCRQKHPGTNRPTWWFFSISKHIRSSDCNPFSNSNFINQFESNCKIQKLTCTAKNLLYAQKHCSKIIFWSKQNPSTVYESPTTCKTAARWVCLTNVSDLAAQLSDDHLIVMKLCCCVPIKSSVIRIRN